jgi:hypothetical protein
MSPGSGMMSGILTAFQSMIIVLTSAFGKNLESVLNKSSANRWGTFSAR